MTLVAWAAFTFIQQDKHRECNLRHGNLRYGNLRYGIYAITMQSSPWISVKFYVENQKTTVFLLDYLNCDLDLCSRSQCHFIRKHINESILKFTNLTRLKLDRPITRSRGFTHMPVLMLSFLFKGDNCHIRVSVIMLMTLDL